MMYIHRPLGLIFACLFCVIPCLRGQDVSDLKARLANANGDSMKIEAYKKLLGYFKPLNIDTATFYAEQGLKYATDHHYRHGQGVMISELGIIDQGQGRLELAKERISYGLQIYKETNYQKGIAALTNSLGAIQATKGNYKEAISYFIEALKLHDHFTDDEGLMLCYMNLGALYMQMQDTGNSAKYLFLAEKTSKRLPVIDATISLYNYIAIFYAAQGNMEKALECFKNNVKMSDSTKFATSHVESLLYLATFYDDMHDYPHAMQCLNEGLAIARERKLKESQADLLCEIAMLTAKQNPAAALDTLKEAERISRIMHSKTMLARVFKLKSSIYELQGKYKEALEEFKQQQWLTDSVLAINNMAELASIGATYQFEKSTARITELENLNNRNAAQRNIIILISIALIVILGGVIGLYYKTIGLNKKLTKREEELNNLNQTKNRLFSIIGHDLRWPVARIPTVLEMCEDEDISAEERKFLLDNLSEHTKATVETLDKLLYWGQSLIKGVTLNQEMFKPGKFVRQSIDLRKITAADKLIKITNNVPDELEVYADPTHFDFVIRNLMANALKFTSINGAISVDSKKENGMVIFSVSDNGIGIEADRIATLFDASTSKDGTANEKGTGIGLMLCKEFITKNGGKIWVTSEIKKGSTFYFSVKSAG